MFNNFKIYILFALILLAPLYIVEASSVNVRNNVSSSANSGDNTGENITTGEAKASASVKNDISGNKVEIKTEVKAEANGEKVEINAESTEEGNQKIEETRGGASATIETDTEIENNPTETVAEEPGMVENIINNISATAKNIFNSLKALFT
jgi:hypothetical protein